MRCKCGEVQGLGRTGEWPWWTVDKLNDLGIDGKGIAHTPQGCGPHLLMEGATCRGAAGRWEAVCALHGWHDPDGADCACELTFTEAES